MFLLQILLESDNFTALILKHIYKLRLTVLKMHFERHFEYWNTVELTNSLRSAQLERGIILPH